ncbi:hypothetical protein U1Q18_002268 [Sarracenia purpurea var. burkii]
MRRSAIKVRQEEGVAEDGDDGDSGSERREEGEVTDLEEVQSKGHLEKLQVQAATDFENCRGDFARASKSPETESDKDGGAQRRRRNQKRKSRDFRILGL